MMDMMSLFFELNGTMIMLVTKPFFLGKYALLFGVKTTFIVIHTWLELVKASIRFHVNMIWRTIVCIIALASLPIRVLTALQRERLLEQHLLDMQWELENLVWDRKELEDRLQTATRECRIMESMLTDLEDEHDNAIAKIEQLEGELQDLKDETLQLKEICGKGRWSFTSHDKGNGKKVAVADNCGIPCGIPSWQSSFKGSDIVFEDVTVHKDTKDGESKTNEELLTFSGTGFAASGSIHPLTPSSIPRNLETIEVLDQRRGVAISQSIFSAVLSLLVGMIIWEAEDPCMPLVMALFTAVGMSLRSVVQFFSTIKNKPASDAVALLSFNWFVLGTLTYPTLPKVARVLAPMAFHFVSRLLTWFGIVSPH